MAMEVHMRAFIDLKGQRFGRLLVKEKAKTRIKRAYWLCQCDCGTIKEIAGHQLRRGNTQSCGCYRAQVSAVRTGALNGGKIAHNRMPPLVAAKRHVWNQYKRHAVARSLGFELEFDEFINLVSAKCHYCGEDPKIRTQAHKNTGIFVHNGIDRTDPKRGYEKNNCRPCCTLCNQSKWTMNEEEFIIHIKKIYDYRNLHAIPQEDL
jgi:hypothetical protein